jgi:hypothetical protein
MSSPKACGPRNSAPHPRHVSAISDAIVSPHSGQAVMTEPPQSGHSAGTDAAAPAMNLRPHPQRTQKPQQSPSSLLRLWEAMARLSHSTSNRSAPGG